MKSELPENPKIEEETIEDTKDTLPKYKRRDRPLQDLGKLQKEIEQKEQTIFLNLIKTNDKGKGVLTQDLIDITKWPEEKVTNELQKLSINSEVFEIRGKDRWRVLA